jgi:hypothetical protein
MVYSVFDEKEKKKEKKTDSLHPWCHCLWKPVAETQRNSLAEVWGSSRNRQLSQRYQLLLPKN